MKPRKAGCALAALAFSGALAGCSGATQRSLPAPEYERPELLDWVEEQPSAEVPRDLSPALGGAPSH